MKHYVYILFKSNKPIYVGCTSNIGKRILSHSIKKDFDYFKILKSYPTKKDALIAENAIIRFMGLTGNKDVENALHDSDKHKSLYPSYE